MPEPIVSGEPLASGGAVAAAEPSLGPKPFSWSASRHDTFMSCKRRYYYSYYASAQDPEIYRLKKLSALPLWAGSVVHDAIESFLREHNSLPSPEEQEALIRAVVHSGMLADWRVSEAGGTDGAEAPVPREPAADTGAPSEAAPLPFRLFEHEYGIPVEQEDKRIAVNIVMRSLKNFFKSETLRRALALGRERWLALEDLVSFHVGEVEVMVRMDLAYRDEDGRVVIVDWKTGRNEGRFNEVQVGGYALYAAEQGWVQQPEEISTELNYLVVPKAVRRPVDGRKIDNARRFIEKSAGNMKALLLDPLLNQARLEDFPMVERPSLCRRCNFRRLCFPRGSARDDGKHDARGVDGVVEHALLRP
jgi:CRISPR/Cas system-associated exonuclease Cas4 (RecB family)